jgi:Zn-dependent M28 family amino/carboxypeptidase
MKPTAFCLALFALAFSSAANAQAPNVDEGRLRTHIKTLASDFFEGRAPGSRGDDMATTYVAGAMAAMGLEPGGADGSWFQEFTLNRFVTSPANTFAVEDEVWKQGDDVMLISRKADGSKTSLVDAPLLFAGYGVVAPQAGWNDYAGVDWKGKIAVVLINDPDFEATPAEAVAGRFAGKAMTWYGRWVYKFEEAARQGAAGVLIIHEDAPAAYGWGVVRNSNGTRFDFERADKGASLATVEGWMQRAVAVELLRKSGLDFETLKRQARTPGFRPIPLNQTATISLAVTRETMSTRNVVGILRGTERPRESVVLGAHHDHLGRREPVNGDDIYNGAIDNAAGVASVLEIARIMAAGPKPKRSVVFASWAAEEQGLLGSDYYVNNPVLPLGTTAAAFTIDGLAHAGPTGEMEVLGAGKSDLDTLFKTELTKQGRRFVPDRAPERGGFYRSDHFPFARAGVPALFPAGGVIFGNGEPGTPAAAAAKDFVDHHYHKPDDEYDPTWDLSEGLKDIATILRVIGQIANSNQWPRWNRGDEFEGVRAATETARR